MKKSIGLLALALAFAACNKNEIEFQPENAAQGIPFSATVSAGKSLDTRALAESGTTLEATWAVGEKVALIHNGVSDEMTVSSVSEGLATITGTITGSPSDGDDVTIIYPSSAADGTTGNVKSDLLYRQDGTLTGTEGTSIAEKYDVRKGASTLKVSGTASLNGNVSLDNQIAIFKFTVRAADGTTAISAKLLVVIIGSDTYRIAPKTATDVLYAALPAVSAQEVRFVATEVSGKTYSCAKASATFSARKYYQSTLKMNLTTETMNGHDYVDMGYGMKWATMNIGASSPEEGGDFFAWGETAPKSTYSSSTYFDQSYQTYRWQSGPTLGRPIRLKREDDAAHVLWGDDWRMPNYEECQMLSDKTKFTWAWDDAKKGYKVTSKQTGNSIFLPAAGRKEASTTNLAGVLGGFWASSSRAYGEGQVVYASALNYSSVNTADPAALQTVMRTYGYPIRPIRVNKVNGHEYIDMGNGLGWAVENLGTDAEHPSGGLYSFDNGDPATREWGAPWRTALWTEWKKLVNEENSYKENSASFEQKGWWIINRESLYNNNQLPDRCIFLPATTEDGQAGGYWTGTKRQADGKRWMVYINDDLTATDYTALDEWYRAVRPVFTLPAPEDNQGNEGMNDGIKFQHLDQYTTPSDPDPFDF